MNTLMDHKRHFLLAALFFVAFLLWQAWQKENPPAQASSDLNTTVASTRNASPPLPPVAINTSDEKLKTVAHDFIHVYTDVLEVTIDRIGGAIVGVRLLDYPAQLNDKQHPFILLNPEPNTLYTAESGLIGNTGPDQPTAAAHYTSNQTIYRLLPGQTSLPVQLTWKNNTGLSVKKIIQFHRNDYLIHVNYQLENKSTQPWLGYFYAQLKRKNVSTDDGGLFSIKPYVGAVFSTPESRYEKISFEKMQEKPVDYSAKNGWFAILQHYFLSAWIPDNQQAFKYTTSVESNNVDVVTLMGDKIQVQPGESWSTEAKLYTGPAIADRLKQIAPGLDLTVDYGVLWLIGTGIFWVMKHLYSILHNWGWSIVLVTVLIKLLFYKLSATSYRSMAAMRRIQPKLAALKERYGDDRQKMSQAVMELYKTEKINPLSGCLPVLVQIPFFLALYWVLIESVQLRQAPWILWIHDLSVQDPYYVLPIVMGLTILIQQKMNPPPPDPMQAKIMMFLPFIFTLLFLTFPAGLVLYWIVNNTLSILQQWYVTEQCEKSVSTLDYKKRRK